MGQCRGAAYPCTVAEVGGRRDATLDTMRMSASDSQSESPGNHGEQLQGDRGRGQAQRNVS